MSTQPEALRLADRLDSSDPQFDDCTDAAAELRRLHAEVERLQALAQPAEPDMVAVLQELADSAEYWGEYDVPLGIVDRIKSAITKAKGAA